MCERRLHQPIWLAVCLLVACTGQGLAQDTFRVSVASDGTEGDKTSSMWAGHRRISADGRFVVFESEASTLVPSDTGYTDIFVHDRQTGATVRMSEPAAGGQPNGHSEHATISADGRFVAFESDANNLVANDSDPSQENVFVRDRDVDRNGTFDEPGLVKNVLVSVWTDGTQQHSVYSPSLSGTGRYVVFWTSRPMVADDTNAKTDVYLHDRDKDANGVYDEPGGIETTRVSLANDGSQTTDGLTTSPVVSDDGNVVAFQSSATTLVPGDTNNAYDVFVRNRAAAQTVRVSVTSAGFERTGDSMSASMSADGRFVAFHSQAALTVDDTNGAVDVYVRDRSGNGSTSRVSVASDGSQAAQGGLRPQISGDGQHVAFYSSDPSLVPNDFNLSTDVFVHDRATGTTRVVSLSRDGLWGDVYAGSASDPSINADGSVTAFDSTGSTLVDDDTNRAKDVFVRDETAPMPRVVTTITPTAGSLYGGTKLYITGRGFQPSAGADQGPHASPVGILRVRVGPNSSRVVTVIDDNKLVAIVPSLWGYATAGVPVPVTVTFTNDYTIRLYGAFTPLDVSANPGGDPDGDGMTNDWETRFNLDPLVADGGADPDGDGKTNLQEFMDGTHPRGFVTRYLAEGAASSFFEMRLAFLNPGAEPAGVLVRFLGPGGTAGSWYESLAGLRRSTLNPADVLGAGSWEISTVVESDVDIVVDRTMWWTGADAYASHAETAVVQPATKWYLAEGATHSGFSLFYLIQNPNSVPVNVQVTYLLPPGTAPLVKTYTVAASSRFNIWVNLEAQSDPALAGLAATDVSAVLESTTASAPIIVERAMYLDLPGQMFGAGHESAGTTAPALSWFLAEGATGSFFDLFVLIANPNPQEALATATYLLPDGSTVTKNYQVPANSRFNIWVDLEDPALADTAVSTTVTVTNGVPVIVERSMWWPGPTFATWSEAHNSFGATATGTAWALAEGEQGPPPRSVTTYILIANTSSTAGAVTVTLYFTDDTSVTQTFAVSARSRFNVDVGAMFPEASGRQFAAIVESTGTTPAQIVVERAMYSNALSGQFWAAGTNAVATRLR